ncbi:MAG: hypothetical protein KKC05_04205, partial [Nanoarchaeota archaeon]|nr:hypothetical protein [Nanoarchaeota archaeon]
MRAFYPVILILLVLVSGCVQQETGDECQSFDVDECPNDCVVCPPCEECSSITCQTEEFCNSIGFDRDWSNRVNGDMSDNGSDHVPEGTTDSDSVQEEEMGPPTIYGIGINLEPYNPETGFAGDVSFDGLTYENRLFIEFGASMNDGGLNVHPMFVIPRGTKIRAVSSGIVSVYKLHLDDDYDVHVK